MTTARAASRPTSRTLNDALILFRGVTLVTRPRRERPTSNSSPWPPTGLADGFGPEKPYSSHCPTGHGRRFTPGNTWVPGSLAVPETRRGCFLPLRELAGKDIS